MRTGASRGLARELAAEWPTWVALAGCYLAWALSMAAYGSIGLLAFVPMALSVGFHSSLQHEILHGHPTRNAGLNEALVWLPLGLYIPYRRFRDNHLRHHNDDRLTDPHDDPESFYVAEGDYARTGPVTRTLLAINATFAGRMVIGPALALNAFWRQEWRRALAGDREVRIAWAHHAAGVALVLPVVGYAGAPIWLYMLFAAYPALPGPSPAAWRPDSPPSRNAASVHARPRIRPLTTNT